MAVRTLYRIDRVFDANDIEGVPVDESVKEHHYSPAELIERLSKIVSECVSKGFVKKDVFVAQILSDSEGWKDELELIEEGY